MPGRREQNKTAFAKTKNCYQLDTFFKGIGKTVNESKQPKQFSFQRRS